jgi:hypothetical protein
MILMEQSYPPPPPAPAPPGPAARPANQRGFHGPPTSFFLGIRARLAAIEGLSPPQLPPGKSLSRGLLVSLIVGAVVGFPLAYVVETAIGPAVGTVVLTGIFAGLIEEPCKALAMIAVAYLMWKMVPNRRYGAVLGAAAGLGFGVVESILYIISIVTSGLPGWLVGIRIIVTPLMHPLWSAFVGVGVFALVASTRQSRPDRPKSPIWIPFLFLLLGIINHMIWDSISLLPLGLLAIIIDIIFVFPIFALTFRDFLGGHFNFQNFLESPSENMAPFPTIPPPPPPPPPT